ncbi:hypothetical protein ACFQ9R_06120 [Nocardia sp. NPDC056541]|uniref:hypothetical protein n=1 Tax=Nocardia sp. NPDC056541 TaxID=3345860 RepID=UPI00367296FC
MVLDEVWRGLDGVDALSGADGGPLRRTVKLILDPLVLRPMQHPGLSSSMLDEDGIALLTALLHAQSDALRACAAWFVVLKQVRRRLRITEGNAQDLYFQRCFELATVDGAPGDRAHARAEATLREVHDSTGGRTTAALKHHVTDPARAAELAQLLDIAWARRPLAPYGARDLAAELTELLEACTLARSGDPADAGPLFDDIVDSGAGTRRGIALWLTHPDAGADDLGLTSCASPQRPELGASASTASLGLPFDRTVYERVFTVLQGSIDRTDLPEIAELVTREISRSCSPWGLLDESLRVAAAAGTELALGLSPFGAQAAVDPAPSSRAHDVVNGRWRREGYVLQARRYAVHAVDGQTGPLATVAAELHAPWRPYSRRLWVRLHGRDVRELPVFDPGELWDLLDGVARSVILDHRTRVKQALTADTVADVEARAS